MTDKLLVTDLEDKKRENNELKDTNFIIQDRLTIL